MSFKNLLLGIFITLLGVSCSSKELTKMKISPGEKIKFMTLDPGHFHAGLVHKSMYPGVDSMLYIFAPDGPELNDHLARIQGYNSWSEAPTAWEIKRYTGADYLEQLLAQKPGNVMVVAGKNDQKIDYILEGIRQGIHVYADKPLVINAIGFQKLQKAYQIAEQNKVLLLDMMTERFEITTLLQRELSMISEVFGELEDGTAADPAITKESVHHFYKSVSGVPLVRPDWFFDVEKEGTGIVDVTTHLVDLIQWEAFPNQVLDTTDIQMYASKIWTTALSLNQFRQATQQDSFPDYLAKYINDNKLGVFSNGEFQYTLRGKHAKVRVVWEFQAPEGTGDTHFSLMRGTKANLIIRQGREEGYRPVLYVKLLQGDSIELARAVKVKLQGRYPGIDLQALPSNEFKILVPAQYHNGHEAHFAQVTAKYLDYLRTGTLPVWEIPNTMTKYFTTTKALELARK
ncbi:MAG: oxidoreductase [Bacteroidetes bacterium]|nr:oxidoreductase [Bacteroidota bacterium]